MYDAPDTKHYTCSSTGQNRIATIHLHSPGDSSGAEVMTSPITLTPPAIFTRYYCNG